MAKGGGFLQGNPDAAQSHEVPLGTAPPRKPQAPRPGCTDGKCTRRRGLPESPSFNPRIHESVTTAERQHLLNQPPPRLHSSPVPGDAEPGRRGFPQKNAVGLCCAFQQ